MKKLIFLFTLTSCASTNRFTQGCMSGMRVMYSALTKAQWQKEWTPHSQKACEIMRQTDIGVIPPGGRKI